ncbi:GH39 family glycosyl hydrolase [Undibacterium sp. Di27W]|uniref:GH39 family glycosyl hydrolase n=1 Tax=Undibacterium sp. Di27W TaxID=3413036 RepID=UPI003BEFC48F
MPITLHCDLNATTTSLRHPWRICVGSGHATLALRADWQAQLRQAHDDLGFQYIRFHGLLDDDMGTLICQSNQFVYSFFNADQIFDFLVSIGMRPVVEMSFMPSTLSSGGDIVFHYKGNITPPRHPEEWGELMRRLTAHWVDRYGINEVAQWYFEVWNEPNLPAFWTGGQQAYFDLYETTVKAIKGVDTRLRVGGPASAGNAWIPEFQEFCKSRDLPADFISTHYYPTDAFGEIGADTVTQLEHAPLDVMREHALSARVQAEGKPLLYTEWNITSNPRDPQHDGSFAAALATRIVMGVDDVVDAYSYWTFSDIFEENYFPSQPFHGGFGLMTLHGIKKPIYQALAMVAKLGEHHYPVPQSHPSVMLWIGDAHVLCINQAMPRHDIKEETITLTLQLQPGQRARKVDIHRIDADNANPAALWRQWGEPGYLSAEQVSSLKQVSEPQPSDIEFTCTAATLSMSFTVAAQSVNLLAIEWESA